MVKYRIPISISLDEDLVKTIDEVRSIATRSRFIEQALMKTLDMKK